MSRFVQGCLITVILASLSVGSAQAGLFDLFRRDCRGTRSRCRCSRPHREQRGSCHTPQPTPQPTTQPARQPARRTASRPGTRSFVVTTPPSTIAAQPATRGTSPIPTPHTAYPQPRGPGYLQPQPHLAMTPARVPVAMTPASQGTVIYRREAVISQVPVTNWQTRWVDTGQLQTVWVPRIVARRVPQTTWQPRMSYRLVPYQRMATPVATTPSTTTRGNPVPDPLEVTPVTTPTAKPRLRPNTAARAWQARGRLGR